MPAWTPASRKCRPAGARPRPTLRNTHHQEDSIMRKFVARAGVVALSATLAFASAAQAQTKSLTLCWAAWDPANALVELSKDFTPATVLGYSEWPKNTPNYWALPAMGDSVGWTYRKDWFNRPEIKAEFKTKYKRDLAPPKTWDEFKQVAEFFQNRTIDGKKVYGAYVFTERGSEGITMGVTNVLYPFGFKYDDPKKPYVMSGFVNSPDAVKGLEFYKSLYKCCTSPGLTNAYMQEGLDAFKSGQVAMMMNWFAFFPGLYKDPNVGGEKIGFFINPSEKTKGVQLGGQGISVVAASPNRN